MIYTSVKEEAGPRTPACLTDGRAEHSAQEGERHGSAVQLPSVPPCQPHPRSNVCTGWGGGRAEAGWW